LHGREKAHGLSWLLHQKYRDCPDRFAWEFFVKVNAPAGNGSAQLLWGSNDNPIHRWSVQTDFVWAIPFKANSTTATAQYCAARGQGNNPPACQ
jgi:hypothetical protein